MPLLQLADETLLRIAVLVSTLGSPYERHVYHLALACKRLSRVCDAVLWRRYKLVIRSHAGRYDYAPNNRNLSDDDRTALFQKRAAHLLSKACVVRELTIDDASHYSRYTPFVSELLDVFMPSIEACTGVTSLTIRTSSSQNAHWPERLWPLILHRMPRLSSLHLDANFIEIPRPNEPPKELANLKLRWCSGLVDDLLALEMLLAPDVEFVFYRVDAAPAPRDNTFTPPPQLAQRMTVLRAIIPHGRLPGPQFDVSPIPHAEIDLQVYFTVELKCHLPPAWREVKPHIASLVSDDMRRYEVRKPHEVTIRRPSLVQHPDYVAVHQAHTRSVEIDMKEQLEMDQYYAARRPFYQRW